MSPSNRATISIAMATFNGEEYLQEQLESFANQTRLPDELVVCDDSSIDGTLKILSAFKAVAPFEVRIFSNFENLGFVKNFERAISLCRGQLICISDQDDVWFPGKLSTVEKTMVSDRKVFAFTNNNVIADENLTPTEYTTLGNIRKAGRGDSEFGQGCCTTIRNELVRVLVPFPSLVSHDAWIKAISRPLGARKVSDEPLQYYRRHGSNTSQWLPGLPGKYSRFQEVRRIALSDASASWRHEIQRLEQIELRLSEHALYLMSHGIERQTIDAAVNNLRDKREVIKQRIDIVGRSRVSRLGCVLRLYYNGGYRYFLGLASAVNDLIR